MLAVITALLRTAQPSFHIALGDLPTWALFVGAVIAAYAALRQLGILRSDSARQTRQLERQQADKIDHSWCPGNSVQIIARPLGSVETAGRSLVTVLNGSPRPIRDVTSRIETADGTTLAPVMFGVTVELKNRGATTGYTTHAQERWFR